MTGSNRARSWPTASTTLAGVVGRPIDHSLSPVLHNAAFHAMGLDWAYAAFDVGPGGSSQVVEAFRTLGLGGLSVTMPLKEEMAQAVDRLTPVAKAVGAVNTVSWDGEDVIGDITDGLGFLDFLDELGFEAGGRPCAVLGAGGAARAIIHALASRHPSELIVVNRTPERAEQAVALAPELARAVSPGGRFRADLIVNATPAGMASHSELLPLDKDLLEPGQLVCDLVYGRPATPLLAAARAAGAVAHSGLAVLINQAAHQIEQWTGQAPPLAVMSAAALSATSGGD